MMAALAVFAGGGLGALARWGVSLAVARAGLDQSAWPIATFAANLVGACLIGLMASLFARHAGDDPVRLFAITGLLGGFTTFSAFSLEAWRLLEAGQWGLASAYCAASVVFCIAGVGVGLWAGHWAGLALGRLSG